MLDRLGVNSMASLVLRLVLAAVFLYHGIDKIRPETGWGTRWGTTDPTWEWVALQVAVAWGEVVLGGFALGLGLLTRPAAVGGVLVQMSAAYYESLRTGFSTPNRGGWELNLCLIAMCLALVFLGGGKVSLDYLLRRMWGRGRVQTAPKAPVETPPLTPVA